MREKIRVVMFARGIKVPELARMAGLSPQTLYNYFAGRSNLSGPSMEKIIHALNLKIT